MRAGHGPFEAPTHRGDTPLGSPAVDAPVRLRDDRARLVADEALAGAAFGRALADVLDRSLAAAYTAAAAPGDAALVALGSYARRELCPGSDVDVLLVHEGKGPVGALADALWYPLWDAGFVTGHAARTLKDAVAVADSDLAALTSMLGLRVVAGSAGLAGELERRIRTLAVKRRRRVVEALAQAAEHRTRSPGALAELVEPDLKESAGGLRDVQSLDWAGWTLDGPAVGLDALVAAGFVEGDDPGHLAHARELLLHVRVALHRITGRSGDHVPLQEQPAIAAAVGAPDADVLLRDLATAGRSVTWIAGDAWDRLGSAVRGPARRSDPGERVLAPGIVARDGRVALAPAAPADRRAMLRVAVAAAEHGLRLERATVARLAQSATEELVWDDAARADLVRLLLAGHRMVPVVEALDRTGGFAALVPGWARVRSLPQRNAYHRYTIDRHLLEAVARTAELLDDPGFDGEVARGLPRRHLLVLAALFHDIGKGLPGDHSHTGADIASDAMQTLGFPAAEVELVDLLVEHHLLLADTATRRDLSEEATVVRVARLVGDVEALSLLYLLTVGDSIATGASAWSESKAALVRELYVKARHLLERGQVLDQLAVERRRSLRQLLGAPEADRLLDAFPASYPLAFDAPTMAHHDELLAPRRTAVDWAPAPSPGRWVATVVAPDRRGMLAAVTAALALHGLDVHEAAVFTRVDGMALEAYVVADPFGRLAQESGRDAVTRDVVAAVEGALDRRELHRRIRERAARYAGVQRRLALPRAAEVVFAAGASDFASVVEVHADDEVGLLARITRTLDERQLDVRWAKVATIGDRVVDAFSVRTALGESLDAGEQEALRAALLAELGEGAG
jgi:[protein-PII] uridylyltransferase